MRNRQKPRSLKRTSRGVTGRKRGARHRLRYPEEALHESEQRFRLIAERSYDAITAIDSEGRFTYVSPSVTRILGYRPEELMSAQFQSFVPESEMPKVIRAFNRMMKGENVEGLQLEVKRKNGHLVHVEASGIPILKGGRVLGMQGILRDITERKKAEEILRLSEAKYRALVDNATDFIFLIGEKDEIVSVNPAAARFLGKTVEQVLGKSLFDAYPKEIAAMFSKNMRVVLQTGRNKIIDEKIAFAGNEFWINTRLEPVLDDSGRAYAVTGISRDITARKRAEEERAEYETRLLTLHTHASKLSSAKDIDKIAKRTLDAMELTLGFAHIEFMLVENDDLQIKGSRGAPVAYSAQPLDGCGLTVKAAKTKKTLRISDTRKEPAYVDNKGYDWTGPPTVLSELIVPVLTDDEVVAVLCVDSTRTDNFNDDDQRLLETLAIHVGSALGRLRHEEQVRRYSENLEQLVMERTKELSSTRDRLGYVLATNPAVLYLEKPLPDFSDTISTFVSESATSVLGFEPKNFLGESGLEFWRSRIHPDDLTRYWAEMPSLWRDGHHAFEYRFLHSDGTYRWIRDEYRVTRDTEGRILHAVSVAVDATERKKLEEKLAKAERLAAIGQTAAMVGHDLRNPLQGMAGALYLLKKLSRSENVEDGKEVVELLDTMDDQILYMDKVVSDLQSYAGPVEAEPVETNLSNLVGEVILNAHVPGNVKTHVQVQGDLSNVLVDRMLLQRVLVNLVLNAVQAMPKGGTLTVTASKEEGSVTITVEDTGEGIARENLDKIFNPFFTTKSKGQGLGLAVCRRLVEAQDGTIAVKSEFGKGSTFTLRILMSRVSGAVGHGEEADPSQMTKNH